MPLRQLGKGYYVQQRVLLEKWEGICLPEDQFLKVLSICRMFDWKQLHWLKVVSVLVGYLNKNIMETLKMICEMLTDEPEGGSAQIPMWMFRECFTFLAELDCSEEQTFINGRKVLSDGTLEEETEMVEIPKILSTIAFKNTIIDEFKRKMGYSDNDNTSEMTDEINNDRISELSEVPKFSSNIKFFGNYVDPYEVIKRAPDFESVLILLEEIQGVKFQKDHESENEQVQSEENIEETEEMEVVKPDIEKIMEKERLEMLKEMGSPWLLMHLFAAENSNQKSFNFIEGTPIPSDVSPSEISDDSFDVMSQEYFAACGATGRRKSLSRLSVVSLGGSRRSSISATGKRIVNEILTSIICMIEESIIDEKCSLSNTDSIINAIDEMMLDKKIESDDHEKLKSFLEIAKDQTIEFHDLNELYNFFVSESFKSNLGLTDEQKDEGIVSIFGESGIEVDHKILEKQISENMILGLVQKADEIEIDNELSIKESTRTGSAVSESTCRSPFLDDKTKDEEVQTTPFDRKCGQLREESMEEEEEEESYSEEEIMVVVASLPGIGGQLNKEFVDSFLNYLQDRALQQSGMIFPRNFYEKECPKLFK